MQRELNEQLDSTLSYFDAIFETLDAGTELDGDDPMDLLDEAPLEIKKSITVVFATGGPHVEAVADLNKDGSIYGASVYGYWGGKRSSKAVTEGSGLWRALQSYAETVQH